MYTGVIIKESLQNDDVLGLCDIQKVELWPAPDHTPGQPAYWTAIHFVSGRKELPGILTEALKDTLWYVDMRENDTHTVIVLSGDVIRYPLGDKTGKQKAQEACKRAGGPGLSTGLAGLTGLC